MKRLFFLLFLFLAFTSKLYSQRAVLVGLQTDLGVLTNRYSMDKSVLKSHGLSYNLQLALSLQYQLWERVGLEIGVSQSALKWRLKDKDFENRHPGFEVDLRNKAHYYGTFANLQLLQPLSGKTKLYVQGGYSINNVGAKSFSDTRNFVMDNEDVTSTATYMPYNTSINAGIGLQFDGRVSVFNVGLKVNFGQENLLKGSYQVEKDGAILQQDNFFSNGSFIGLNAKYSIKVYQRTKKARPAKPVRTSDPIVVEKKSPVKENNPDVIEGRKVNVTSSILVASKKVTVKVWDHQTVDGDRISLYLNGKWVLKNYTLQKQQYVFEVELNQGKNIFVLHALNLGKIHPNTAAVVIHDGVKEQRIVLESTLQTSGTIEVTYSPGSNK